MDDEINETLDGTFKKIIYKSSNYMVSIFDTSDGPITVTGPSFDYNLDDKYTLVGKYIEHPKYGFQFNMISVSKYIPSAKDEIIKYLSSTLFKKVGKVAASKIYEVFKEDTLKILKEDISKIEEVNITRIQKDSIIEVFSREDDDTSDDFFKLISYGFSSKEVHLILNKFKEDTLNIVLSNPYKIYLDVYGISFKKVVDAFRNIDFEDKEQKFKEAYLIYLFKDISFKTGNIYLDYTDFSKAYFKNYPDLDEILEKCIDDHYLTKINNRYYLTPDYYDELFIAKYLKEHNIDELKVDNLNLENAINDLSKTNTIEYDKEQRRAIANFFTYNLSLIIGGPGTGKTTVIKALVDIFTNFFSYNNIIVLAPTGRAAKRINEICNVPSKTIHSLLRWNKEDNTFGFDENNPLLYDAIIIDEFSMVDNNLFASLLKASDRVSKICIIGDDNQLPSIRQGNLLYDLIASNQFPFVRLKTIHRQKEGNEIIKLANDIVEGDVDFSSFSNDVSFIDINSFKKEDLVNLINLDINNGFDFKDIQVLSPMYRGEFGIDSLNLSLQTSFNPKDDIKIEKRIADTLFREKDKILQLKNRPDDDVYNGDIGTLEEIDLDERTFLINYNGTYIFYSFDDLIDISLAYALSVHKSQGSEYSIVYFICSKAHSIMLYKKLIYTAISRAKNKLFIIGDIDTFKLGINKEMNIRKTTLIDLLSNSN